MRQINPTATEKPRSSDAGTLGPSPDVLAKRFFLLTMAGLFAYIAAILLLMLGSN